MGKRKRPTPDAIIPTSSTNTLVASRHSSAHPGMLKSDVGLSANNATIPAHMSAPPEKTHKLQTTSLHMFSEHHSDTPQHAKQKYSSPQCTSPHNQIFHAPRTAAAHTQSNKCSSGQCYPRAAVGSKQKRRAVNPQKSATTGRKSTERSHSNEFRPNALSLPPSPTKGPRDCKSNTRSTKVAAETRRSRGASCCHPGSFLPSSKGAVAHWHFQTTLYTCNASFGNAQAPSARTRVRMKQECFAQTATRTAPRRGWV
ncbi:hypothetical protein MOQ_007786 [Trypanosoma cruzi marinkellei]|uniref:Uncharacterized protein n=1 Tax=Trypanosoma cruzi marinkellei TaxID=85056 RepID=K2MS15_TRYCR|nr:hypothetical protein MOQ_007786 [Trypanosoma cruzi marinkellei]